MGDEKKEPEHLNESTRDLLEARKDFVQMFKRGAEFSEELLRENERLRYRLADVESRGSGERDESLIRELVDKVQRFETERQSFISRVQEVEAENSDFASRYSEIESENNNLLNIYVASYQLHSTLDFEEVLQIITEIVLNFVGADQFGILLVDEEGSGKSLVEENMAEFNLTLEDPRVAEAIETGDSVFATELRAAPGEGPVAVIPLRIKHSVIGVIAIFCFLPQKETLAPVDHELFTLLAGHAATAIFSAKLYSDSKRKLNTIQGFLNMVTNG